MDPQADLSQQLIELILPIYNTCSSAKTLTAAFEIALDGNIMDSVDFIIDNSLTITMRKL